MVYRSEALAAESGPRIEALDKSRGHNKLKHNWQIDQLWYMSYIHESFQIWKRPTVSQRAGEGFHVD